MAALGNANKLLVVRPVRAEDGPALYEIVKHPRAARTLLQQPSMGYREIDQWPKNHQPGRHRLVAIRAGWLQPELQVNL